MSRYDKKYDAFQIFEELLNPSERQPAFLPEKNVTDVSQQETSGAALSDTGIYYEIEYDSCPMPGVGKFVQKSRKIDAPVRDEVREIFDQMRDIARDYRSSFYSNSRFFDRKAQQEKSRIFYHQGLFMKDFEDDYSHPVPYSSYFPCYQMMGYEQLRTYFTWRTKLRRGTVTDASLSYAYLYLYELLNHIGVADPQDGLDKLMAFWTEFRVFNPSIDRYVLKWLKDYHIYYDLPVPFQTFIAQNRLTEYYRELSDPRDDFELLCSISRYDVRNSAFYTAEQEKLIRDCIYYTLDELRLCFTQKDLDFDEFIFQPTRNLTPWTPFKDALFYPWLEQRDRRVIFSEKEIYLCSRNQWQYSTNITNESGRKLLGYVLKRTEAALRQAVRYKYKLTANIQSLHPDTAARLLAAGISLEEQITKAVSAFYREATKTVVKVNPASLEKIRKEAKLTQEKLIVPEEETVILPQIRTERQLPEEPAPASQSLSSVPAAPETASERTVFPVTFSETDAGEDPWSALKQALGEVELTALTILLENAAGLKDFADARGIMLEVLIDKINEKAMDFVGDSLVDEEFAIYEDYIEQVRRMVK